MILWRLNSVRFQTKVLVPVIAVMVLLVAVTMYVVNYRITRQLQKEAGDALKTAEAVFKNSQEIRLRNLRLRFENIASEPRWRAVFLENDQSTINDLLAQLRKDLGADPVRYRTVQGNTTAPTPRDSTLSMAEFDKHSELSSSSALEGRAKVDTIRISDRLFDIVSVPVTMPSGQVIGALTLCFKIGEAEAEELSQLTGCGIVLIANNHVVASSLHRDDLFQQCVSLFDTSVSAPLRRDSNSPADTHDIIVPQEHFLPRVGRFESLSGDPKLGYVLLYSYAPALRELRATQRMVVTASFVGMLIATTVVWLLIRNVTKPLRELRDSAEAVSRGDFSYRVKIGSQDEFGKLARVFNRMTENLQSSRQKLEETVTTLKTTQAQLVQSEKLSAIGEFVAGVTHELNNPLTSLLGFSELLEKTNVDVQQRRFVDYIGKSARRCQKIVQSLLSFARQHQPERKVTNINELVEAVIEIMAYEMRTSNIDVETKLDPALPKAMVDPHQVQQVFLNLVNNARQAMEAHQSSGMLRIRTESADGRIRVTFSDNGPGISPENLSKIFNPFFTTKEAGKGTGLGLSLSYGIIQEHGGTIKGHSKSGEGATFVVELPIHTAKGVALERAETPQENSASAEGKGKRVLVVDDEEAILDFVTEVLRTDGYEVETARDGETALRHLRAKRYDLTLCDWKMPGLNGQKLYERVNVEEPESAARFLFMTGDVVNTQTQSFLEKHRKVCLAKPFSIVQFRNAVTRLSRAVNNVL